MNKIVFFDLDGTILSGISSENAFFLYLLKQKYIRLKQFISFIKFNFKWLHKYKLYVFIKNKAYLAGLSAKEIKELGQKFVKENLLNKIRPSMKQCIEEHRKSGDILILLTGAHEFMAKVFGEYLNIPFIKATECVIKSNYFSELPPKQHPFAQEKLTIAKNICKQYKVPLKNCFAYGNSINDKFLLQQIGHPVAVHPDKKLIKLARKKGWKILNK